MLRRVRRVKAPEEVEAIRASVRVAEGALAAAEAALAPGVTERQLTGVFMEAMAAAGVTTPSAQDVAWTHLARAPWRRASRDVPVEPGDLVAFDAGVIVGGYVRRARPDPRGRVTAPSTPSSPAGGTNCGIAWSRPAVRARRSRPAGRLRRRRAFRRRPCPSPGGWGWGSTSRS